MTTLLLRAFLLLHALRALASAEINSLPRIFSKFNFHADFGDDDLRDSLASARSVGIPLCTFGHMHAPLRHGGRRRMVCEREGTVYVNAAEVPRHRQSTSGKDFHYTIVDFGPGDRVDRVAGVWLSEEAGLVEEEVLWRRE